MNTNKDILQNLVAVCELREIRLYKYIGQPITALQTFDCDWLLNKFIIIIMIII